MVVLFAVLQLVGGLAFFLYGMNVMSGGLGKLAGGSLERSLKKATSNPLLGMGLGAGITIAIQSSSAMTVMLVGLVNSGLMEFSQTINVIMGSNIGTTATNWILSLAGVEGNGLISLLKPENFSPIVAIVGIGMIMMSKKTRRQDLGKILVGFAVLMYGMKFMGEAMSGLQENESFRSMLTAFDNPAIAVILSAIFTGVIQSSAATISIVQNLAFSGLVTYSTAIPLVLGANIGTCATALLSSIGVTKEAKKVSVVHITIKIIGVIVCLAGFLGLNAVFHFGFLNDNPGHAGVALIHTIFNVVNTVILFPFEKQLIRIADFIVRPAKKEETGAFLDERLLSTPSIAVNEAMGMTKRMAKLALSTLKSSLGLLKTYDADAAENILKDESELDNYEDKLGSFLVRLSSRSMSDNDSRQVSLMLHSIGDFERLGDHAVNLLKSAREINDKEIVFSPEGQAEIDNLTAALNEILELTISAFAHNDTLAATKVEPLEQVIDVLISKARSGHIDRLQQGRCTIQMGFVLSDLLTDYERISDHCSNVAVAIIETAVGSFDTHAYLNDIKTGGSRDFVNDYRAFGKKYHIE